MTLLPLHNFEHSWDSSWNHFKLIEAKCPYPPHSNSQALAKNPVCFKIYSIAAKWSNSNMSWRYLCSRLSYWCVLETSNTGSLLSSASFNLPDLLCQQCVYEVLLPYSNNAAIKNHWFHTCSLSFLKLYTKPVTIYLHI